MKPEYANTFGIRKVCNKEGEIIEVALDIVHKYMETTVTVTPNGLENITTPASDHVASIVMNKPNAIALRNLLVQTLGWEE